VGSRNVQEMCGLDRLRPASAREQHTPVRTNQVPRHPKACPTLQADSHRTTDRLPNKIGHN